MRVHVPSGGVRQADGQIEGEIGSYLPFPLALGVRLSFPDQ